MRCVRSNSVKSCTRKVLRSPCLDLRICSKGLTQLPRQPSFLIVLSPEYPFLQCKGIVSREAGLIVVEINVDYCQLFRPFFNDLAPLMRDTDLCESCQELIDLRRDPR